MKNFGWVLAMQPTFQGTMQTPTPQNRMAKPVVPAQANSVQRLPPTFVRSYSDKPLQATSSGSALAQKPSNSTASASTASTGSVQRPQSTSSQATKPSLTSPGRPPQPTSFSAQVSSQAWRASRARTAFTTLRWNVVYLLASLMLSRSRLLR